MDRSNEFDPRHLRGILERVARAERAYDEAQAKALIEVSETAPDAEGQVLLALAALTPKVGRASRKLAEARIESAMADHLLAGHLRDSTAAPR